MTYVNMLQTYTTTGNTLGSYWEQEGWLAEVTYKPGWRFELQHGSSMNTGNYLNLYPGVNLIITAAVPDSNDPQAGSRHFMHVFSMPPQQLGNRDIFLECVLFYLFKVEQHEAMEYLKYAGRRVLDPHPDPNTVLYHART